MVECQEECNSISEVNLPYFYDGRSCETCSLIVCRRKDDIRGFKIWSSTRFVIFISVAFIWWPPTKKTSGQWARTHTCKITHTLRFSSHRSLHCPALPQDVAIHETKKESPPTWSWEMWWNCRFHRQRFQNHKNTYSKRNVKRKGLTVCTS